MNRNIITNGFMNIVDHGMEPYVIDIEKATKINNNFRTTIWTGAHLQTTLMSIPVGGDIGLEIHHGVDQFLRIEQGLGLVQMGKSMEHLTYTMKAGDGYAIFVPAETWHNIINIGRVPLKLYSIYAPPQHPQGTIHQTKAIAEAAEGHK